MALPSYATNCLANLLECKTIKESYSCDTSSTANLNVMNLQVTGHNDGGEEAKVKSKELMLTTCNRSDTQIQASPGPEAAHFLHRRRRRC